MCWDLAAAAVLRLEAQNSYATQQPTLVLVVEERMVEKRDPELYTLPFYFPLALGRIRPCHLLESSEERALSASQPVRGTIFLVVCAPKIAENASQLSAILLECTWELSRVEGLLVRTCATLAPLYNLKHRAAHSVRLANLECFPDCVSHSSAGIIDCLIVGCSSLFYYLTRVQ